LWQIHSRFPKPPTPTDPIDIAARTDLGRVARWWGFVGSFKENANGTGRLVALYWRDSDLNDAGMTGVANFFSLKVAIRDSTGKWIAEDLCSGTRTHFGRVLGRTPSSITVELRPEWMLILDPNWSPDEARRWLEIAAEANTPSIVTVSVKDGRPVASVSRDR
jgi:hypothetical protein